VFTILESFNQAMLVINSFAINIFERITIEDVYLVEANEKGTLRRREIKTSG
jgi:hypothetical protein